MAHPDLGDPPLHRLNRVEYENTVHDLLGIEVNLKESLPEDQGPALLAASQNLTR